GKLGDRHQRCIYLQVQLSCFTIRIRHTGFPRHWSTDVCYSDLHRHIGRVVKIIRGSHNDHVGVELRDRWIDKAQLTILVDRKQRSEERRVENDCISQIKVCELREKSRHKEKK